MANQNPTDLGRLPSLISLRVVLSIAVALFIGSIELIKVLHDDTGFGGPVVAWIAGIDLNNAGFAIVGLFVLAWIVAIAYWRLAKVDQRWSPAPAEESA